MLDKLAYLVIYDLQMFIFSYIFFLKQEAKYEKQRHKY